MSESSAERPLEPAGQQAGKQEDSAVQHNPAQQQTSARQNPADYLAPSARVELSGGLIIRELASRTELVQATALYRAVFNYAQEDGGLNPRMLESLRRHSGSVLGAVDTSGEVLAFAFGWTAVDATDGHIYHYSQAAVVDGALQGHGVGRELKRVQAGIAARSGAHRMRWTFDPLLTRNAHFNFDVLGARGRWFHPELFGPGTGTDRITVDWPFTTAPTPPPPSSPTPPTLEPGTLQREDDVVYLAVPAAKPQDTAVAHELRESIRGLFAEGYEAVSCRLSTADTAVYRFET